MQVLQGKVPNEIQLCRTIFNLKEISNFYKLLLKLQKMFLLQFVVEIFE